MIIHHGNDMENLADILARLKPVMAQRYAEMSASQPAEEPLSSSAPGPVSETSTPGPVDDARPTHVLLPSDVPGLESPDTPDYIQAEAFLEMSGFFTPSSKRIHGIYVKEKQLRDSPDAQGKRRTLTLKISANHELGLPITADLDYYRAFLKICDETVDRDGRFKMPLAVPTSLLIRYAGKQESAKEWQEVRQWWARMTLTGMQGAVYRAKHKDFDERFIGTVFSQVVTKGERLRNGRLADTNYVWLSPWFLSNYYHRYTHPLDFTFSKRLRKPIAKSLYTLLENGWYAAQGQPYAKSYRALCAEFLLTPYTSLARIQQQLDPSHQELTQEKFLASFAYRRSADKHDYVLVYTPGQKFFDDQKAKAARRQLAKQIDAPALPAPKRECWSPPDPLDLLLADILATCGDPHNTAAYVKLLKIYSEATVGMALSETRQAHLEGRITKSRGAYFTDMLQRLAPSRP